MRTATPTRGDAPAAPPKRRHVIRWVALGVVVVLVGLAILAATRPSSQATALQSPLLGKPAPQVSGTSFTGQSVSLSHYRGRYVLVNFFASWCPPCQEEEPNLVAFNFQQSKRPGSSGAVLVSVVFDDPDDAARQFVSKWGATWPTIPDPGGAIASSYGVTAPPTTFLIDPAGKVVAVDTGPVTSAQLDQLLSRARADGD